MAKIAVVNFGSRFFQYFQGIVQDAGLEFVEIDWHSAVKDIEQLKPIGIILSGSPWGVYEQGAPTTDVLALSKVAPVLGVCYGAQLIAYTLGGRVDKAEKGETGQTPIKFFDSALFDSIKKDNTTYMCHNDRVYQLPDGFKVTSSTTDCPYASFENAKINLYATQFHPEADEVCGKEILNNFFVICNKGE